MCQKAAHQVETFTWDSLLRLGLKLRSLVVVGLALKGHVAGLRGQFAVGGAATKAVSSQKGRIEVFDKPQT